MGEVVKTTAKAAKKGLRGLKILFACLLATLLVVGSAGGSFLVISKTFETKLNRMVDEKYKGETGATGAQGPQGLQGVSITGIDKTGENGNYDIYTITYSTGLTQTFQVKNGDDGEAPVIGPNGNWWINGEDTGVLADVELNLPYIGTNGNWWVNGNDTGKTAQGQDGQTPYIKNGNWWIGDTNMGVSATGKGILSITPLAKNTPTYNQYITEHNLTDLADLTDVYQITYTDFTPSYFHVTNGRGGNGTGSGVNGKDGTQWSSGDLAPVDTLSNPGDFYLYTTTNEVYQKQCAEKINLQYTGKMVEKEISKEIFDELKGNADDYGLKFFDNDPTIYYKDTTWEQIEAMMDATKLEQSFYYYVWNYIVDGNTVHLSGYIGAEGALNITTETDEDGKNKKVITPIHYTWVLVSTLNGENGKDGANGATAYEVWRDFQIKNNPDVNPDDYDEQAFFSSLVIGRLDKFVILSSGFWGEEISAEEYNAIDENDPNAYLYEKVEETDEEGEVTATHYYKNTQISARGEQGAKGQKGDQGAQGVDGLSAYDLYYKTTDDNPKKSVNEWLASLVGQKGEQGGDGYTPTHNSLTNTWWINGKDTGVTSSVSVYIGANGNWYINNADTEIKARGDQGIAGNGIQSIVESNAVDGLSHTYTISFTNPGLEAGDEGYMLPFTFTVKDGRDGTNGKNAFELWQEYTYFDETLGDYVYPNAESTKEDFFKSMTGNGITSITKVKYGEPHYDADFDTYKITYTNGNEDYFTVTNGKDGKDGASLYDIWCEQHDLDASADHYDEFFSYFAIDAINGLTILESGNWGIWAYGNYEAIPDGEKDNYVQGFDGAYYKDTGVQAKGDSGAAGKSAYEIYLDTVPSDETPLTKSQWLASLKGETGAAGKDAQLEITENGYWKIGGVVTNMKVTGEKGEKGDTPYISADGFWCVGDKNLGVPARGLKGDQGEMGVSITDVHKLSSQLDEDGAVVDTYEIVFSNSGTSTFYVTNGTNGTNGKDGSDVTMDFGEPSATAKDGDIYINLNNGEMYRYNNGWGAVVGTMRGSQWFTGAKNLTDLNKDSSGLNIDGYKVIKNDLYLNTVNRDVYKYDGTTWVELGNLGGAGAVKTDPVAWLDTTTLPNLPDGAAIGKWGVGGDTNWTNWSRSYSSINFSYSGGIFHSVSTTGSWFEYAASSGVAIKGNTIAIIKWKSPNVGLSFTPASNNFNNYQVISGSCTATGDWQTTVVKYLGDSTIGYGVDTKIEMYIESFYVGKLDYSTQLMDLSGNYNNMTVSGNYMTNDGLVLNKTVTSNATTWNTTNMTYFVDFADVKQNGNGTALFGVGTPGAASQFSVDINANRDLFINGSMAGRTLANGKPLTMAVRVDASGKCQYTVDGVAWTTVNTDAESAVSGAQLYFGGTGSVLRRAMVFDYLLDDAAVYAVFNHQIADLPNPQSPYKKDNPKTWGDGVLIDFGDGTAGFAKKITYESGRKEYKLFSMNVNNHPIGRVRDFGGSVKYHNWEYALGTINQFYDHDSRFAFGLGVFDSPSQGLNYVALYAYLTWVTTEHYEPTEIWVWCIFEYNK